MKLTNYERETVILWNEESPEADIYTHNPALQRQLQELCEKRPEQVRQIKPSGSGSMSFRLPKKWIKVSPPRIPSPAQLEVLARMTEKRCGGPHGSKQESE